MEVEIDSLVLSSRDLKALSAFIGRPDMLVQEKYRYLYVYSNCVVACDGYRLLLVTLPTPGPWTAFAVPGRAIQDAAKRKKPVSLTLRPGGYPVVPVPDVSEFSIMFDCMEWRRQSSGQCPFYGLNAYWIADLALVADAARGNNIDIYPPDSESPRDATIFVAGDDQYEFARPIWKVAMRGVLDERYESASRGRADRKNRERAEEKLLRYGPPPEPSPQAVNKARKSLARKGIR